MANPITPDQDPVETQEWRDALASVVEYEDAHRAEFLLAELQNHAKTLGVSVPAGVNSPYLNTISKAEEAQLPSEDKPFIQRLMAYLRWNALVLVMRVAEKKQSLGGHIASYAAIADLYEIGLHYFFHKDDLVFFQGHSCEGLYARAFLEGRLSEAQMDSFRREAFTDGLSSYPHPHLMPDFWQFPTVSLGLGLLQGIYQAQFMRYLQQRELVKTDARKVWVFCGDGEMSEVDSTGALSVAGRDKLDNLVFIVNCNIQRLDGPVFGNGQIIQELEGLFKGAGWHVIKVIWGSGWDAIFAKDTQGLLKQRIADLVDGEWQSYCVKGASTLREKFFGQSPELAALVADLEDAALASLQEGGHDPQKIYAAFHAAKNHTGSPVVILAKTIKGYSLGQAAAGVNITHNLEEISREALADFAKRYDLSVTQKQLEHLEFLKPKANSPEMAFLKAQREKLGGSLPSRSTKAPKLTIPPLSTFQAMLDGSGERSFSSNMAFVRVFMPLFKDPNLKDRLVPIVADEARTLGFEGLFRQVGIYAPQGQRYEPEDRQQLIYYREEKNGQLMEQGISEAGSLATWIAAGTAYANYQLPMIPVYIYYAMFGYQRVGDLIWAAADIQARGFLVGGLAGRTTLSGEGLQHQDAHNVLMFSFVPTCKAYDLCFSYEIAVIMHQGLKEMYEEQQNVFYYFTVMNESYQHPPMPKGAEAGIVKGMYLFSSAPKKAKLRVQLLGSGAIFREVIQAAAILEKEFGVHADVWGVTSFNQLRRDKDSVERYNRLHPDQTPKRAYVAECLEGHLGPVIAASDYMKLFADQIRSSIDRRYVVLGTDGFGRSDTRPVLRDFFEVDAKMIAYTALKALADEGEIDMGVVLKARDQLHIATDRQDPWTL